MAARTSLTGVSISDGYPQLLHVADTLGLTAANTLIYDANGTPSILGLSTDIVSIHGVMTIDKANTSGIKVDTDTPTFGFRDILGNVTQQNIGASKPTFATYRDTLKQYQFAASKEEYFEYHIPHDYVIGTDIFLHVHWSHNSTDVTGGSIIFTYEISYSKSHNQAPFSASVGTTFTGNASTTQYQQILTEVQISAASPNGNQIDSDNLEPDGLIMTRFEVTTNNITSGNGVPDPFVHYVDIHYQSTNIATKNRTPDFNA